MTDPTREELRDEETAERKPELEAETLQDLTPPDGDADDVKGGPTTPGPAPACYCGTW